MLIASAFSLGIEMIKERELPPLFVDYNTQTYVIFMENDLSSY